MTDEEHIISISDDLIEAAARAEFDADQDPEHLFTWEQALDPVRRAYRDRVRAGLAAVLPASTSSNPQQKLDDAIEQYLREVGWNKGVLTGYVLVGHQQWYDGDDSMAGHPVIYKGGAQPLYITLGLLEYALIRTRASVEMDDTDE